jgi:S-adenosylmethionine:tRNA ribosyltransferase-isomerase
MTVALAFELPAALQAHEPPEAKGLERDEVRLLVGAGDCITHARFRDLPRYLQPRDLLVVNVSATVPAALDGRLADGTAVRVHHATRAPRLPAWWGVVELRTADGARPRTTGGAGEVIALAGGLQLELVAPYAAGTRLWLARDRSGRPLLEHFERHGEPIRYGYVERRWPLSAYQTVYARTPGSAEMPSAGRPFTHRLLTELIAGGVAVAPLTLHAGVSSPERSEPPFPEQYEVPEATARLVQSTHAHGGRVIAVGTTVVRALETVATADGHVAAGSGWTGLVISPERGLRAVDGLITGWHEPEASHLQLLEAVAGRELLERCYAEALEHGYLWHEFGDSHLLLP